MAEEEKKTEATQEQSQDRFGFMKDKLSSFISKATEVGNMAYEKSKVVTEKTKDTVNEKLREIEADRVFMKLGKNVYKLVLRNEIQLPESCDKYIEAVKDIYGENDVDVSTEMSPCEEKKCEEEASCGEDCECDKKDGE